MAKTKTALAFGAAIGLMMANPALASTRSGDALPRADVAAFDLFRASEPVVDANEQSNPRRSLLLALFAVIGAVGLLIAASSGGGGGGNDSPG